MHLLHIATLLKPTSSFSIFKMTTKVEKNRKNQVCIPYPIQV